MPFQIDSDIIENDDAKVIENANGDLVVEHVPSGQTFELQSDGTVATDALDTERASISEWRQPVVYTIHRDESDYIVQDATGAPVTTETDWGAAAQYCVDNIPTTGETGNTVAAGGGRIHTTAGNYITSTEVVVPGSGQFNDGWIPVQFSGEGAATTIKQADNTDLTALIEFTIPETDTTHNHGVFDMRLEGNKANNAGTDGIRVTDPGNNGIIGQARFINVTVLRCPGDGFDLSTNKLVHAIVEDCLSEFHAGFGLNGPTTDGANMKVSNLKVEANGSAGVRGSMNATNIRTGTNDGEGAIFTSGSVVSSLFCKENSQDSSTAEVVIGPDAIINGRIEGTGSADYAVDFASSGSVFRGWVGGSFATSETNGEAGNNYYKENTA